MNHSTTELNAQTGVKNYSTDQEIEAMINDHCDRFSISGFELVFNSFLLMRRQHLKRFLLHTELFKKTLDVPGDIAELGVYRGLGLMTWANLLESYCIGDRTKTVHGFDNWSGFSEFMPEDGKEDPTVGKVVGGFSPQNYKEELESVLKIFDSDRFVPWKPRVKLHDGDICETIPQFVEKNPGVRFSLVHFDADLYQPTKVGLNFFWEKLSRGGIMVFDEYAIRDWPGETAAVDEFFSDKPDIKIQTVEWTNVPAGWIVKP